MMNIRNASWLFTAKINGPHLEAHIEKISNLHQYIYRRHLEDILFLFEESLLVGEVHPDIGIQDEVSDKDRQALTEHQAQIRRLLDLCPDEDHFHIYRPPNHKGRNSSESYPTKLL